MPLNFVFFRNLHFSGASAIFNSEQDVCVLIVLNRLFSKGISCSIIKGKEKKQEVVPLRVCEKKPGRIENTD